MSTVFRIAAAPGIAIATSISRDAKMSNRTGNDLLMSGGAAPKGISYEVLGQEYGGKVLDEPGKYHAREFDRNNPGGGALKYWPDGNPVEGVNIDFETNERDPQNRNDNGTRRFYIEKPRERQAIADAVNAANASLVERDAYLFVTWTCEESGQGAQPAKTFTARYIPAGQVPLVNATDLQPRSPQRPQATVEVPTTGKQKVPSEVFVAMINAGLDISGFEISS
jgi:hypothetical protein